jgi:hypothetical protein
LFVTNQGSGINWVVVVMVAGSCQLLIVCEGSSTSSPEDASTSISLVELFDEEG